MLRRARGRGGEHDLGARDRELGSVVLPHPEERRARPRRRAPPDRRRCGWSAASLTSSPAASRVTSPKVSRPRSSASGSIAHHHSFLFYSHAYEQPMRARAFPVRADAAGVSCARGHLRRSGGRGTTSSPPRWRAWRGADAVVLGIPRGGVVVAAEVARALALPLAVAVVRKLGAPSHEEYAVGAIAEGVRVVNPDAVRSGGVTPEQLASRRRTSSAPSSTPADAAVRGSRAARSPAARRSSSTTGSRPAPRRRRRAGRCARRARSGSSSPCRSLRPRGSPDRGRGRRVRVPASDPRLLGGRAVLRRLHADDRRGGHATAVAPTLPDRA